ncbi:response regulator [Prosthecomicrobium sp. N25]|uniref:response regulator n=1 Tax=Prosthecomicrobium sp. N25 TaxID=3129254 RepID=UPI0030768ECE
MSMAALVGPQVPFLRRFARALTGSQDLGDLAVTRLLERLAVEPGLIDRDLEPRVAVYRAFVRLWNAAPGQVVSRAEAAGSLADHRLRAMTPLPRQAFLLTAVEGFDEEDAAEILGQSPAALAELLVEAGREIGAQVATRVLVIEDEPIIAMELESLVESLGHTVIGNARTHAEALSLVRSEHPGLILADIRLADGSSGLDAVNEILRIAEMPVIFITAFPEYLLTGRRPEPAFLITKPFRGDMVRAVISQALFFDTRPRSGATLPV